MFGPLPAGTFTKLRRVAPGTKYRCLETGRKYRVLREFRDFDGDLHPPEETWTFLDYAYLPYEDGLSLFVSVDGVQEWHIRMQERPEAQLEITQALQDYVVPVA